MSAVVGASLLSLRLLHRQPVLARDRRVGELADVLFDDARWVVRYLVVDTVDTMPQRDVLIQPSQVESFGTEVALRLTRDQFKHCPDLDEDRPLYLQYDMHGVPRAADPHLRSAEIILGFAVRARGGAGGRLKDIEIDPERWTVAALVIESGVWLPGKRQVVAPSEVRSMDWIARTIEIG
jgi:hypothetical protein